MLVFMHPSFKMVIVQHVKVASNYIDCFKC